MLSVVDVSHQLDKVGTVLFLQFLDICHGVAAICGNKTNKVNNMKITIRLYLRLHSALKSTALCAMSYWKTYRLFLLLPHRKYCVKMRW